MSDAYYLDLSFQALGSKFEDRASLDDFVSSIRPVARQEQFLFAASRYLFLVKRGDWHVSVEGVDPVITYFTQSYKLVGMFAVIESLAEKKHVDFHQWLSKRAMYPISDRDQLAKYFDRYNEEHCSIRRCKRFFGNLPRSRHEALCNAVRVNGQPLQSIQRFATFLYELRSKFVHEAKFVLQVSSLPVHSGTCTSKSTVTKLDAATVADTFEEGLVAWFAPEKTCDS